MSSKEKKDGNAKKDPPEGKKELEEEELDLDDEYFSCTDKDEMIGILLKLQNPDDEGLRVSRDELNAWSMVALQAATTIMSGQYHYYGAHIPHEGATVTCPPRDVAQRMKEREMKRRQTKLQRIRRENMEENEMNGNVNEKRGNESNKENDNKKQNKGKRSRQDYEGKLADTAV